MGTFALQSVPMVLIAFLTGLLVGWLVWARRWAPVDDAAPPPDPHPDPESGLDFFERWTGPDAGPQTGDGEARDGPIRDGQILAVLGSPARSPTLPSVGAASVRAPWGPAAPRAYEGAPALEVSVPVQASGSPAEETSAPAPSDGDPEQRPDQPQTEEVAAVADAIAPTEPADPDGDPASPALIDDLTRIDGVTTTMAEALAAEGLGSFFAVANAREDDLRRALRVNRIRSAPGIALWSARAAELVQEERAREPEAAPPPRTRAASAFTTTAHPSGPSWTTVAPVEDQDLERVHGVDRRIAEALRGAGVVNYTVLAAVRDEELRQILDEEGLEAPPTLSTWTVQAALLLQGDEDGAATLAGSLMIGRDDA